MRQTPLERFMENISPEPNSGCWLWTASCLRYGYGRFRMRGSETLAHRASYIIFIGEIPSGMCVCHKCDVRSCVNPEHLFLGTQSENIADAERKGRNAWGVRNRHNKLSEDEVRKIRMDQRPIAEIARSYNVTDTAIWSIKHRKTWKKLP